MRGVAFVDQLMFSFPGNHFSHALCLGDVDNDQANELVIGNVSGALQVFKGTDAKAWRSVADLGTITALTCGDLLNSQLNIVVVCTMEAKCFLFDFSSQAQSVTEHDSSKPKQKGKDIVCKPFHEQELSLNVNTLLISEFVSGLGHLLVVGRTDRIFSVYQWKELDHPDDTSSPHGYLVLLFTHTLDGQIGSLSATNMINSRKSLLVSQPGGIMVPVVIRQETPSSPEKTQSEGASKPEKDEAPVKSSVACKHTFEVLDPIGRLLRHSPNTSTEVVGGLSIDSDNFRQHDVVAMAMLDGSLKLCVDSDPLWTLKVTHNFFAAGKLHLRSTGSDVIVACAWDGTTYIVDHLQNVVKHHFHEDVCAFTTGMYGNSEGKNVPCLVYTTFSRRIYIFCDVDLETMTTSNALEYLESEECRDDPDIQKYFGQLNDEERRKLIASVLYQHQS